MSRTRGARSGRWGLPVTSTVVAVLAWEVLSRAGILPPELSPPSAVGPWLWSAFQSPDFWSDLGTTLHQWLLGLLIAIVAGVGAGLLIGTNRTISRLLQVPLEFLRAVPSIIYLPLLLLLFGSTNEVGYGLAAVGAFWPMLFQTVQGLRSIDRLTLETGRMFGLTRRQQVLYILIPGIAPSVATGVRVAASISLVVAVTIELVGGAPGVGAALRAAQLNAVYPEIYGLILVMGAMGLLVNIGLEKAEGRVLTWHEAHRP